jgi:prohibitin 1
MFLKFVFVLIIIIAGIITFLLIISKKTKKKIDLTFISDFLKFINQKIKILFTILLKYKIRVIILLSIFLMILFIRNLFIKEKIWVNIPPGYRGIVFNRFGGGMKDKLLGEGSIFYIPFLQSIYIVNLTHLSAKIDNITADSIEFQDVVLRINVEFSLQEENILKMYRKFGMRSIDQIISDIIESNTNEAVKNIIIKYPIFQVLLYQSKIKDELKKNLKLILSEYYLTVYDVDIENILISSKFRDTLAESELARKKKETEEILLEQIKIESQRKLVEAENSKKIKILEAEGMSEYNRLLSKQKIDSNILEFKRLENKSKVINKWDGKLPVTTGNLEVWPFD